jgi:hypothetical protein
VVSAAPGRQQRRRAGLERGEEGRSRQEEARRNEDGLPAERWRKKEMRVTGVPSLWDNDENESRNGNEGGKVQERPRGVLVTERDITVLRWISEQFAVRADVIRWLLGGDHPLSEGRTRQVIDRWRRAGLVNQRRFFLGAEPVVWPTREGLRLVLDGYRARTPALSMLAHIHAVSLVRLGLERRGAMTGWVPERALYRARPSPDVHVADGEYTDRAGRRTAVEVELTVKAAERLRRIISDLTLEYDQVVYVTGDGRVAAAVRGAVRALGEADRVELLDLATFALPQGAP